jgi:hypothetical protein
MALEPKAGRPSVYPLGLIVIAAISAASCHPRAGASAGGFVGGDRDVVQPASFDRIDTLLKQTAAIVRAKVTGISYAYGNCLGPRTIVSLDGVQTLAGTNADDHVELVTFGGKLPDGHFVSASELPRYVKGASYILFLRNTDWRFSPVIGDLAFREENIAGRPVLIDSDGFAVSGVGPSGIERHSAQLMEPVANRFGSRLAGEMMEPSDSSAATPCKNGNCEPSAAEARVSAATGPPYPLGRPVGQSPQPAVLGGIGRVEVADAISPEELMVHIKRAADASHIAIGGKLQFRPRLGCWMVTPTDPWRKR